MAIARAFIFSREALFTFMQNALCNVVAFWIDSPVCSQIMNDALFLCNITEELTRKPQRRCAFALVVSTLLRENDFRRGNFDLGKSNFHWNIYGTIIS